MIDEIVKEIKKLNDENAMKFGAHFLNEEDCEKIKLLVAHYAVATNADSKIRKEAEVICADYVDTLLKLKRHPHASVCVPTTNDNGY